MVNTLPFKMPPGALAFLEFPRGLDSSVQERHGGKNNLSAFYSRPRRAEIDTALLLLMVLCPSTSSRVTHFAYEDESPPTHALARANTVLRRGAESTIGCAFCSLAQRILDAAQGRVLWGMALHAAFLRAKR